MLQDDPSPLRTPWLYDHPVVSASCAVDRSNIGGVPSSSQLSRGNNTPTVLCKPTSDVSEALSKPRGSCLASLGVVRSDRPTRQQDRPFDNVVVGFEPLLSPVRPLTPPRYLLPRDRVVIKFGVHDSLRESVEVD